MNVGILGIKFGPKITQFSNDLHVFYAQQKISYFLEIASPKVTDFFVYI